MFQVVSNIYNRNIVTSLSLEEFINTMKSPGFVNKSQVDLARKIYKESPKKKDDAEYKSIKSSLPCITFLNYFDKKVKNEFILDKTGFMYLDIDNIDYIDLSMFDFVVAYWKSLSNNGYGILIKCTNVSEDLSENIKELSELFNLKLDNNAVSKDRLNVIGYDYNIYFNPNYTNYDFNNKEKVSFININTPSLNRLSISDTEYQEEITRIRFSNLEEIVNKFDFKGKDFEVLEEKIPYAEVFVPKNIFEGNRNKSMFIICSQIRGLNTWISHESLFRVCSVINKDKFKPELSFTELNEIVRKVFENKTPLVMFNKTRRILYNPKSNLSKQAKKDIRVREMGGVRRKPANIKIFDCIEDWDFELDGKINFEKIATKTQLGIATVKRRSKEIKQIIQKLNEKYLQN